MWQCAINNTYFIGYLLSLFKNSFRFSTFFVVGAAFKNCCICRHNMQLLQNHRRDIFVCKDEKGWKINLYLSIWWILGEFEGCFDANWNWIVYAGCYVLKNNLFWILLLIELTESFGDTLVRPVKHILSSTALNPLNSKNSTALQN